MLPLMLGGKRVYHKDQMYFNFLQIGMFKCCLLKTCLILPNVTLVPIRCQMITQDLMYVLFFHLPNKFQKLEGIVPFDKLKKSKQAKAKKAVKTHVVSIYLLPSYLLVRKTTPIWISMISFALLLHLLVNDLLLPLMRTNTNLCLML